MYGKLKNRKDSWLKKKQRLPTSDVAEPFVSVTDVDQYIYCPRLIYIDTVLRAQPVFGWQQEESGELHQDY